jgi:AraC-like DNA-binding protein
MQPLPEAQLADLGFQRIPPHALLSAYVRHYWTFRRDSPLLAYREAYMHPRGGYGMVFNFGDRLSLDGQVLADPVFLDGSNTVSRKMGFLGRIELMGVSFWEGGAYPFLGVPLVELRDETALLDVLDRPGLMQLYERLAETGSLPGRIQVLNEWLLGRLALGKARALLIPASLAILRGGVLTIPELAQNLAISQRQLERLYQVQVGMSPKHYAQLARVENARLNLKRMSEQSTTRLAVELGFYDQAHFIREFRAVVGMTPYRYMQRSRS